ncbi:MAG: putative acetyltransferase [Verrucomicrobiaceae bacterium]|nr:putative acetyltransferase [Verrucomicrobiaceae bacterium]
MIPVEAFASHLVPCTIRDYTPADHEACVAVYASHVPQTYPEAVMEGCLAFLQEGTSYHLVLEHESRIIGCAGLEVRGEGPFAHLVFGFIHRDYQGRGFGTTLLAARLSLIGHEGQVIAVQLEVEGPIAPFYERFGFELAGVRPGRLDVKQASGEWVLKVRPEEIDLLGRLLAERGVVIQLTDPSVEYAETEDFEE